MLEKTNLRRHDIVVMTVRQLSTGAGEYDLRDDQLFADYEQELFSHVVSLAEKEGKSVELLVVPAVDPFDAMVQTAAKLQASRLVTGVSARMASEELAQRIGLAWERLPEPRHPFSLEVIGPDRPSILREPGSASAAAVAGGSSTGCTASGCASATSKASAPSCITAMWSEWRCSAWSRRWPAPARPRTAWQRWKSWFRSTSHNGKVSKPAESREAGIGTPALARREWPKVAAR